MMRNNHVTKVSNRAKATASLFRLPLAKFFFAIDIDDR